VPVTAASYPQACAAFARESNACEKVFPYLRISREKQRQKAAHVPQILKEITHKTVVFWPDYDSSRR
jgi:hypothetical protein